MGLRKLEENEIYFIYHNYFSKAFPQEEIRPWSNLEYHLKQGQYEAYGYFDEQQALCSYAFFMKTNHVILLDYFASLPEKRGMGIGGVFLQNLIKNFGDQVVIAEVEAPVVPKSESDDIRWRRIGFYQRNGFSVLPWRSCAQGVQYRFMGSGKTNSLQKQDFDTMYQYLFAQEYTKEDMSVWREPVDEN